MNLGSSINLNKAHKILALLFLLTYSCSSALQLRDIIEPDVIDDVINDVDTTGKGSNEFTENVLREAKTENEKEANLTAGHEQISIAESGMDNTTTDDESIKIQE